MSGGTLSPGAPGLRSNAGPFAVPNVTGTTGTVDCSAPGSCDDSALTVATPAGSGSTYTVRVSVSWPDSAGDFGVYLLLPAGRQVASAASSSDPEVMQVAGSPGSCTVRVVPSAAAGQSITVDISLLSAPLAAGAAQRVDLVWKSAKKCAHTVTAVVDPANTVAESREDDTKSQAIVTVA